MKEDIDLANKMASNMGTLKNSITSLYELVPIGASHDFSTAWGLTCLM